MMIELQNVSSPPPIDAIVFSDPDAVITGDIAASVTEDVSVDANGDLVASGQLTITDADAGEAFFNEGTISGAHGSLTITPMVPGVTRPTTSCPRFRVWVKVSS